MRFFTFFKKHPKQSTLHKKIFKTIEQSYKKELDLKRNKLKIEKLKNIGFTNLSDINIINGKYEYYANKYPSYKFISNEDLSYYTNEHNLYIKNINEYKAYIPEHIIDCIEKFQSIINKDDIDYTSTPNNSLCSLEILCYYSGFHNSDADVEPVLLQPVHGGYIIITTWSNIV